MSFVPFTNCGLAIDQFLRSSDGVGSWERTLEGRPADASPDQEGAPAAVNGERYDLKNVIGATLLPIFFSFSFRSWLLLRPNRTIMAILGLLPQLLSLRSG